MKKKIALLLCALMLVTTTAYSMTACGETKTEQSAPTLAKVDHVYKMNAVSLPKEVYPNGGAFVYDGRIYIVASQITNSETYESKTVLYSTLPDGSDPRTDEIEPTLTVENAKTYIGTVVMTSDGTMIVSENAYSPDDNKQHTLISLRAADKSVITSFDPSTLTEPNPDEGDNFNINYITSDADGNIYIASSNKLLVTDKTGAKLFEISIDGYIQSMTKSSDGRVAVSYQNYSGEFSTKFDYVDIAKKGFGSSVAVPATTDYNTSYSIGDGWGLYIKNNIGLYGYNEGDSEPTLLCSWINSDIDSNSVNNITIIDENSFVYTGWDNMTGEQQLAVMTHIPDEDIQEKYIIELAYTDADYTLSSSIVKFNRQSDKYRITINDYSKYNTKDDYSLGQTQLTNDIVAGKVADIVILSSGMAAERSMISKGVFADLYSLMDADTSFDRTNLLDCVTKPFESGGKLYKIPTSFSVITLAGKKSVVGDINGWTVDDMLALPAANDGSALFPASMTKSDMLTYMCSYSLSSYINFATGECSFNTDAFKKLLTYCASLPKEYDWQSENDELQNDRNKDYREEKILLDTTYLSSFSDYLVQQFKFGGDISLVGFPTSDSSSGSRVNTNYSYAISAKSGVQEGAWAFISYLLSDDSLNTDNMWSFPVTKTGMKLFAESELKKYYYMYYSGGWSSGNTPFDENGHSIQSGDNAASSTISGSVSMGSGDFMIGGGGSTGVPMNLKQEDVDTVLAFLDTLTTPMTYDEKINQIINEEASTFFEGKKSVDETADVIQSRISIYISENS